MNWVQFIPEGWGSSPAVGLGRRWGPCRFAEVQGSTNQQRLVSDKSKLENQLVLYELSPGEKDEPAAKTSRPQDLDSTRRDDKVPMSVESASLVVLRPVFERTIM